MTTYIRLAVVAIILATVAGIYAYVATLRGKVERLTAQVVVVERERDEARQQVIDLTQRRDEVLARQQAAEQEAVRLRSDLMRARSRVQTAPIPSDCPAALQWLAEELR